MKRTAWLALICTGLLLASSTSFTAAAIALRQTLVVASTNDSGPGTLREALDRATPGTMHSTVIGNCIGTNMSGTTAVPNGRGVHIRGFPERNVLGGVRVGEGNVISGNDQDGCVIEGRGTTEDTVSGNLIGADGSGARALGNARHGVFISDGAQRNYIGSRNTIAYNGQDGIQVRGAEATGVRLRATPSTRTVAWAFAMQRAGTRRAGPRLKRRAHTSSAYRPEGSLALM